MTLGLYTSVGYISGLRCPLALPLSPFLSLTLTLFLSLSLSLSHFLSLILSLFLSLSCSLSFISLSLFLSLIFSLIPFISLSISLTLSLSLSLRWPVTAPLFLLFPLPTSFSPSLCLSLSEVFSSFSLSDSVGLPLSLSFSIYPTFSCTPPPPPHTQFLSLSVLDHFEGD